MQHLGESSVLLQSGGVVDERITNQVEGACLQLDGRRLNVTNVGLQPIQIGLATLPVIGVTVEAEMIALDPVLEDKRSGTHSLCLLRAGLHVDRSLVEHVQILEQVEDCRAGTVGRQNDGVFIGSVYATEPVALTCILTRGRVRSANAEQVPFHVVTGELTSRVIGEILAQIELDLLVVWS